MRRWLLNFIEITIVVVVIFGCLVSIVQNTILKDRSIHGYRSYVIASNSMYPVLEYGDVILVKEVEFDDIKVDDIITYMGTTGEFKNKVITHEVIEIITENGETFLKTKGRANTGIDPSVYKEQVYGRLAYKFILISFISKIVRDEIGFIFFIFIPFGILFVLELINMFKETKRRELEKMMLEQLEELKKINANSEKAALIENTICLQINEIKDAKRDFKKMNELEKTAKISFQDIVNEINKLKENNTNNKKKKDKNKDDLEKTMLLFESDDIEKEINKELKNKAKINKKKRKNKSKEV